MKERETSTAEDAEDSAKERRDFPSRPLRKSLRPLRLNPLRSLLATA